MRIVDGERAARRLLIADYMRLAAFCIVALAAGCTGAIPVGSSRSAIIGGTTDTNDPAVVLLFQTIPGQQGGALCTGELISPHVVLTAAHCTGGENPNITNARWQVFTGSDFSQATAETLLPVKEAHFNSAFNVNNLNGGNDVGVAILQDPITTITPLPINRVPVDATFDGQPVRFVGYGLDNAAAQSGAGIKRQTTTTLSDHNSLLLHFTDGAHETCNGDSGGPGFMTVNGQEVIVGLTSFGDVNCAQGGFDTRVDAMLSFIDPFVQANDPGSVPSPGSPPPPDMGKGSGSAPSSASTSTPPDSSSSPTPSGGTQTPPTPPAATSPPSGPQAGAVGASCQHDGDCASGVCGLGDHGNYVCYAADTTRSTGVGCAVAGGRSGDPWELGLMLLLGLALKLRRVRIRARVSSPRRAREARR